MKKDKVSIVSLTFKGLFRFQLSRGGYVALGQLLNLPMFRVFRTESQLFLPTKVSLRVV